MLYLRHGAVVFLRAACHFLNVTLETFHLQINGIDVILNFLAIDVQVDTSFDSLVTFCHNVFRLLFYQTSEAHS